MPHVTIRHFAPALAEQQRSRLAEALTAVVVEHFGTYEGAVSIALRPVEPAAWDDEVFVPEIVGQRASLIKHPLYRTAEGENR